MPTPEIHDGGQDLAARLRRLVADAAAENGVSAMAAAAMLAEELAGIERDTVAGARRDGATWQQVADATGMTSRQAALAKYGRHGETALPGLSAAEVARRLGKDEQTIAANPGKYGVTVKTYHAGAGGRPRKRYFLPS